MCSLLWTAHEIVLESPLSLGDRPLFSDAQQAQRDQTKDTELYMAQGGHPVEARQSGTWLEPQRELDPGSGGLLEPCLSGDTVPTALGSL